MYNDLAELLVPSPRQGSSGPRATPAATDVVASDAQSPALHTSAIKAELTTERAVYGRMSDLWLDPRTLSPPLSDDAAYDAASELTNDTDAQPGILTKVHTPPPLMEPFLSVPPTPSPSPPPRSTSPRDTAARSVSYFPEDKVVKRRRTSPRPETRSAGDGAGVGFINFTPQDKRALMLGVAPSGSSKTKAKRDKEELERRRRLGEVAFKAVEAAGGDASMLAEETKGLIEN